MVLLMRRGREMIGEYKIWINNKIISVTRFNSKRIISEIEKMEKTPYLEGLHKRILKICGR
ncbi:MAG: hypothetical protein HQL30_12615 [Candidatus Omnitrophica bacterium]|nr:hypothetical protein [Candidatus Omnitrophota bacterium]